MNEDVNLISTNTKNNSFVPAKKLQLMRLFAISLLFIVAGFSITLFILVALSPLPELQRQEQSLRQTLAASRGDMGKLALIDERVTIVGEILKDRKQFDILIDLIQSNMPTDVRITSIRVDKNAMIVGVRSNSLKSLDSFLSGMIQSVQNKQGFSQLTLNDLSSEGTTNGYTLSLNLVML